VWSRQQYIALQKQSQHSPISLHILQQHSPKRSQQTLNLSHSQLQHFPIGSHTQSYKKLQKQLQQFPKASHIQLQQFLKASHIQLQHLLMHFLTGVVTL